MKKNRNSTSNAIERSYRRNVPPSECRVDVVIWRNKRQYRWDAVKKRWKFYRPRPRTTAMFVATVNGEIVLGNGSGSVTFTHNHGDMSV